MVNVYVHMCYLLFITEKYILYQYFLILHDVIRLNYSTFFKGKARIHYLIFFFLRLIYMNNNLPVSLINVGSS